VTQEQRPASISVTLTLQASVVSASVSIPLPTSVPLSFTITGKDRDGIARTEAIAGPNTSVVETTTYWSQITVIAASATVGSNVFVGPVDEIITKAIGLNRRSNYAGTMQISALAGTCQFDIQESLTLLMADTDPADMQWNVSQSNKSADFIAATDVHASAIRLAFDSYTSTAELQFTVSQGDW
jgi:hypothetical protein